MAVYSNRQQYGIIPREVPCPICWNNNAHLLYSISSEHAVEHIFGNTADKDQRTRLKLRVEELWQGDQCDFVRCDTCEFCFAVPFIQGDNTFYALAYQSETSYQPWKWEYQETLDALHTMAHRGNFASVTLLEIGAGNGAFVKRVSPALLPKENILCTEYSKTGIRSLANYGISCLSQDIRTLDLAKLHTKFDVVCMFQVLEHLDNLDSLFECLNRITKESAAFFIAVPNDKRRGFYDRKGIIEDVPPTHVGRLTQVSLEILANRHGWKITQHKRESERYFHKIKSFVSHALIRSTFWNHLDQIRNRSFRRYSIAFAAAFCMAVSLPTIAQLRSNELGVSQWARLEKIKR